MKVYVVTEGDYSDYTVRAVFASKESANDALRQGVGDAILEEEVYETVPKKLVIHTLAALPYDKEPSEQTHVIWPWEGLMLTTGLPQGSRPVVRVWNAPIAGRRKCLAVSGTNPAIVRKAFQDRVAQLKAEEAGIA